MNEADSTPGPDDAGAGHDEARPPTVTGQRPTMRGWRATSRPRTAAVLLAATAGLTGTTPAQATAPTDVAVVFSSDRDGDDEIYLSSGTGRPRQLTHNSAHDFGAVWSPDAQYLAFASDRDGDDEIYTMRPDGTEVRQLTQNDTAPDGGTAADYTPAWSPDGQHIAFASTRTGGAPEIWVMRADGGEPRRLTFTEEYTTDSTPTWSPDGDHIAFTSDRAGYGSVEIYCMRADGTDVHRLTTTADDLDETAPDWSPDGRHIAYTTNAREGQQDLYVMNADGSGARLLTGHHALDDVAPRWTSDGTHLVYWTFSPTGGRPSAAIWLTTADGTVSHRIIDSAAEDSSPDPRPRQP